MRWIPTFEAQLRWQLKAVASDQTQERAGFSCPCAPAGQNCRDTAGGTRGTATLQVTTQALTIQVNNNCYNSIYVMSHVMILVLWVLIYSISLLYYYGNILC